jgi:hypothetical protein
VMCWITGLVYTVATKACIPKWEEAGGEENAAEVLRRGSDIIFGTMVG